MANNDVQGRDRKPQSAAVRWLLDSDPSIRWQVMRDLTHEQDEDVVAERARVATEGWGARLLALQGPDGGWSDDTGAPRWESTLYALLLLRGMGIDPESGPARTMVGLLRDGFTWGPEFGDAPFFEGETEPCINGGVLALGGYFGEASDRLLERLLERLLGEQLDDGGWNCEAPQSQRSSFHTTICVLEGLSEYEKAWGSNAAVTEVRTRGQEYLLERGMLRSLSSGEVIDRAWTRFSFPTTWHYDVLRGLDHLRASGTEPDGRVTEAVEIVGERMHRNGRWPLGESHPDPVGFDMESGRGKASRWNTLHAMRVLDWAAPSRSS